MIEKIKKILNKIDFKELGIIALVGLAMSLPFLSYSLGWLVFVSMVPFFWYINRLNNLKLANKQFILRIWSVGVVFFSITISWIYNIRATDLIADPWLRWLFLFLTLAIITAVFAVGFLLFAVIIKRFKFGLEKASSFFVISAVWITVEYIRSFAFSLVSMGNGGSIGDFWNFGNFGFAASVTPFAYSGRLVGFYGICFLVVLINLALFQLLFGKLKKQAVLAIIIAIIVPFAGYCLYSKPKGAEVKNVGLTFLESDYTIKDKYQNSIIDKFKNNQIPSPNLLILPEYSGLFDEEYSRDEDKQMVDTVFKDSTANIITSRSIYNDKGRTNSVVLLNRQGEALKTQDKQFLIPGGEFVPYLYEGILVASGNSNFVVGHQEEKSIMKGTKEAKPISINGVNYGVLACSGAIAPNYYRKLALNGSEVFINTASIASMGLDGFYFEQSKQMVRFQAVANSREFIQSSRGGQSYQISRNGEFLAQSNGKKTQYLSIDIQTDNTITIYTKFGEWVLAVSALAMGVYMTILSIRFIKKSR